MGTYLENIELVLLKLFWNSLKLGFLPGKSVSLFLNKAVYYLCDSIAVNLNFNHIIKMSRAPQKTPSTTTLTVATSSGPALAATHISQYKRCLLNHKHQ